MYGQRLTIGTAHAGSCARSAQSRGSSAFPFYFWIRSLGSVGAGVGGVLNLIGFLGIAALVASVAGFTAALRAGNKKLAGRLYIIPSLLWQLPLAALICWTLFLLSTYEAT